MKRFCLTALVAWTIAGPALAAPAAAAKPDRFPAVPLSPLSEPRYSVVMLDTWTTRVAYVMFDGSLSNGYRRMYLWAPEDPRFTTPKAYSADEAGNFGPIETVTSSSNREASVGWTLGWRRAGGSTIGTYDYMTGKSGKRDIPFYSVFPFTADYTYGAKPLSSGKPLVDLGIAGGLYVSSAWTNLPVAQAPWWHLGYYMSSSNLEVKGKSALRLTSVLGHYTPYYGWRNCTIRALPKTAVISLSVTEYMGPVVYTNTLTLAEAFGAGVTVEMPYGWYDIVWDFDCEGMGVRPRLDANVRMNPYPFAKPAPARETKADAKEGAR